MGASEMSTLKFGVSLAALAALAACATQSSAPSAPVGPNFGRPASAAQIAAVDISIPPSGPGLAAGSGSVKQGAVVYEQKCQVCHGAKGVGKPADQLVGGHGTLASKDAVRTVGSYWPYATTVFDYIRRAM